MKLKRFAGFLLCLPVLGQPRLTNAKLQTAAVAGGFEATVKRLAAAQPAAAWIAWSAPAVGGERTVCCWSDRECGCALEGRTSGQAAAPPAGPVPLEGSKTLDVFVRTENGAVTKVRSFSADCPIDAGGLTVYWLGAPPAAESVAYLASLVKVDPADRKWRDPVAGGALAAIGLIADPAADAALDRMVSPGQPEGLRERASFWLGENRGRRGFETLKRMLAADPSDGVREKVIFALTRSKDPGAIPAVIEAAKNDRSAKVRGQALFWLAQTASREAAGQITRALADDPDSHVRRQAVFALSQLPKDEGIPKLIEVARSHRDPQVRKQAMFWLGQSHDPRAIQFFEQVLTR